MRPDHCGCGGTRHRIVGTDPVSLGGHLHAVSGAAGMDSQEAEGEVPTVGDSLSTRSGGPDSSDAGVGADL